MKMLFYPGCSMQRNARPYLDSLLAIREAIGLELEEPARTPADLKFCPPEALG